jgi:hypothetical protein
MAHQDSSQVMPSLGQWILVYRPTAHEALRFEVFGTRGEAELVIDYFELVTFSLAEVVLLQRETK